MDYTPQPTFIAAIAEIMQSDVAAVALSVDDIFFIANDLVPKDQRIRYGAYLRFIDSLDEYGEPTQPHEKADLFLEIQEYLSAQKAKQKLALMNGIKEGEKDWRRFQWLLQWQEKQERQVNAQTRKLAKAEKEKQQALDALAQLTTAVAMDQSTAAQSINGTTQPAPSQPNLYQQPQALGKVG